MTIEAEELGMRVEAMTDEEILIVVRNLPASAMMNELARRYRVATDTVSAVREAVHE